MEEREAIWVFSKCDLCSETEGEDFLVLKHPEAPGGAAFLRQCRCCGLRRLWPRPGPEIISRYYSSDYGAYVGRRRSKLKQAIWDLLRDGSSGAPGRGRILQTLFPFLRPVADWKLDINVPLNYDPLPRIIDVGCGFGDLLLYWKSRGVCAVGVDLDERAVKKAKELGLSIFHGNLLDLALPAESFDVAVLNHSLEHVPSPLAALNEVARILRSGGKIYVTVPNGASVGLSIEKMFWEHISFPIHFWFFNSETLRKALRLAGFHEIRISTRNTWAGHFATVKYIAQSNSLAAVLWVGMQIIVENIFKRNSRDLIRAVAIRK